MRLSGACTVVHARMPFWFQRAQMHVLENQVQRPAAGACVTNTVAHPPRPSYACMLLELFGVLSLYVDDVANYTSRGRQPKRSPVACGRTCPTAWPWRRTAFQFSLFVVFSDC